MQRTESGFTLTEARKVAKRLQHFYAPGKDMRGYFRAVCNELGYGGKNEGTIRALIRQEIVRIEPRLVSNNIDQTLKRT